MPEPIGTEEMAKRLGLKRGRYAADLCRQGKIEATRPGRDWITTEENLEKYMNRRRTKQEQPA